jgi:hypothetical protein
MKASWGSEVVLASSLGGGEWSASRPSRFTPRERTPGTHWIGGLVDPRAILDAVVKGNIPSPLSGLEPPIIQPVAQRYTTELTRLLHVSLYHTIPTDHGPNTL